MWYTIRPRDMDSTFRATGQQCDELVTSLAPVDPQLESARTGASGTAIVGALTQFGADHHRLLSEVTARFAAALANGAAAVDCYVRGDALMGEAYGLASSVFSGIHPLIGKSPGGPSPSPNPLPDVVHGD